MPNDLKDSEALIEGPGSAKAQEYVQPLVDGLDENFYVEILNPLSVTFVGKVASSRPTHAPITLVTNRNTPTITQNEDDVRRNYGLDLRNPDHQALQHFAQSVSIPPGASIRLPGNEAQVIVRQLVNIIMDKEGNKQLKGDLAARHEVEERIILKQGTMSEFFTSQNVNIKEVINRDLQHGATTEQSFPSETESTGTAGDASGSSRDTIGKSALVAKGNRTAKTAV